MRKNTLGKIQGLFIALVVFCLPAAAGATLITVGFDPIVSVVPSGNTFSVDLIATIDATSPIVSFGLDVGFNPTILNTVSAVVSTPFPFIGSVVDSSTDGLIELTGFAFTPISGPVTLAALTFFSEASGVTLLTPSINPGDPKEGFGRPFPVGGLVPQSEITLNAGAVNVVNAVPEPSAFLLFGMGLIGLIGFNWRRKRLMTRLFNLTQKPSSPS